MGLPWVAIIHLGKRAVAPDKSANVATSCRHPSASVVGQRSVCRSKKQEGTSVFWRSMQNKHHSRRWGLIDICAFDANIEVFSGGCELYLGRCASTCLTQWGEGKTDWRGRLRATKDGFLFDR